MICKQNLWCMLSCLSEPGYDGSISRSLSHSSNIFHAPMEWRDEDSLIGTAEYFSPANHFKTSRPAYGDTTDDDGRTFAMASRIQPFRFSRERVQNNGDR